VAPENVIACFAGGTLLGPLSRRRGIPIGSLAILFFANIYLNGFDHFVKNEDFQQSNFACTVILI